MKKYSRSVLQGKKILFFSPSFFNYENVIKDKMVELGADVYFFDERPFSSVYRKALLKLNPNVFSKSTEKYFDLIFNNVSDICFDYVFFLKCETPTLKVLRKYRAYFKNAKFCLYMWDSISNVKNIKKKLIYFDIISSFDKKDSEERGFNFRPLFYSDEYAKPYKKQFYKYDICSFGTIHSDRYSILTKFVNYSKKNNLKFYFFNFLQGKFMFYFYKIVKKDFLKANISEFSFVKKNSQEIIKTILDSKVVLDIQHPNQTGLTMRTIEMIGLNKKIITTNNSIVNYDFYNKNNILIIDRHNIEIDREFFETEYSALNQDVYKKYSLEFWLYDTLGIKQDDE
ncbi:capsular biosynthesis protein CpsH [Streptococcus iniae]|uniref:capsular biosynthesis protein CpsH n=1 Tax=Streptococcus iniae TaxID=1346 RepID=UPI000EF6FF1C|nr:capsular biosynthesis protein CpsH [Streptococcus iniae]RLV19195.1 capsular biosynthesis protein CpsH [Streptococcus iniae]